MLKRGLLLQTPWREARLHQCSTCWQGQQGSLAQRCTPCERQAPALYQRFMAVWEGDAWLGCPTLRQSP